MALLSIDVVAGDDILASEYNNLRSDLVISGVYAYSPVVTRYLAVSPSSAVPDNNSPNWFIDTDQVRSGAVSALVVSFPVNLPHGAIVTSYKVFMYRLSAASTIVTDLYYVNTIGAANVMASANANANGNHSVEDTTITVPLIENDVYSYAIKATITPNASINDVLFFGAIITYTITVPFP